MTKIPPATTTTMLLQANPHYRLIHKTFILTKAVPTVPQNIISFLRKSEGAYDAIDEIAIDVQQNLPKTDNDDGKLATKETKPREMLNVKL